MIPVHVIYCAELPDRKAATAAHLTACGVEPHWWRAAHGNTWGLDTRLEFDPGKRISPAHVSLNVSTWFLWQHLWNTPLEASVRRDRPVPNMHEYIILEDDAVLPADFPAQLDKLTAELERDFPQWDLVFLGLAQTEPHVWNNVTERIGPPNSRLCRLTDPFGTHAILLRRRALPVLLDHMTAAERNLDQQLYQRVLSKGLLNWCAVLPSLVTQRTFDYTHSGRPEWTASTADPRETPPAIDVTTAQQFAGVVPTVETHTRTAALVDPFPCIYRGEALDDFGTAPTGLKRISVPVAQCARLNRPCHSKSTALPVTMQDTGACVESCMACGLRNEMRSDAPRDRLPLPEGHFNPSLIRWGGRLILATRDSWGHSKVALWELGNNEPDWSGRWNVTPISSCGSAHPDAPRLEDPRLFVHTHPATGRPALHCMFSLPDGYPPKRVQVGYVRFSADLQSIEETVVLKSPYGNLYEKNWVPFSDDDGLHWVYSTKPEHLVLGDTQNWATPNPLPWVGGVVRGGAAPVLVQAGITGYATYTRPVYYHFFHGALKRLQGTVYTIGVSVFDSRPPYNVLRQTAVPLVWPDLPALGEDVVKRYVVFPGGAVAHAGHWFVAAGIDDCACRVFRIPFDKVEQALTDVPETAASVSLRDSPLALGIQE